jgi:hypothetical protein
VPGGGGGFTCNIIASEGYGHLSHAHSTAAFFFA